MLRIVHHRDAGESLAATVIRCSDFAVWDGAAFSPPANPSNAKAIPLAALPSHPNVYTAAYPISASVWPDGDYAIAIHPTVPGVGTAPPIVLPAVDILPTHVQGGDNATASPVVVTIPAGAVVQQAH